MFPVRIQDIIINSVERHEIKIPINRKYPSLSLSFINDTDDVIFVKKKSDNDIKAIRVIANSERTLEDIEIDICELRCGYLILECWSDFTSRIVGLFTIEKWERNYKKMIEGVI